MGYLERDISAVRNEEFDELVGDFLRHTEDELAAGLLLEAMEMVVEELGD